MLPPKLSWTVCQEKSQSNSEGGMNGAAYLLQAEFHRLPQHGDGRTPILELFQQSYDRRDCTCTNTNDS